MSPVSSRQAETIARAAWTVAGWSIPPLDPAMAALDDDAVHREDCARPGLPAPGFVSTPVVADQAR